MTDAFITFARDFGPAVAVCTAIAAFLLWWVRQQIERFQNASDKREAYLNKRLDEVQDQRMKDFQEFNARLIEVVANNTKAFEMLKTTMLEWQGRPCLYEEAKKCGGKKKTSKK